MALIATIKSPKENFPFKSDLNTKVHHSTH